MAWLFPGMNPYIEGCGLWEDFHSCLIAEIQRTLAPTVPERYVVRLSERSYVGLGLDEGYTEHAMVPDVAVVARRSRPSKTKTGGTAVAKLPKMAPKPTEMRAFAEIEFRETFIEIRETKPHHRLVTSIEVLSPSNKRESSPGQGLYLRKRQALLAGSANLVEIDLLRGGQRMPMEDVWPCSPYYLLVSRKEKPFHCTVWPAHFRDPLPEIPVPLLPPDADVPLMLQPLIEAVYARSRYDQDIDYRQPLVPKPSAADAAWLRKQLRGVRHGR